MEEDSLSLKKNMMESEGKKSEPYPGGMPKMGPFTGRDPNVKKPSWLRQKLRPSLSGGLQSSSWCSYSSAASAEAERTIREGPRNDWSRDEIKAVYDSPVLDLLFHGAQVHKQTRLHAQAAGFPYQGSCRLGCFDTNSTVVHGLRTTSSPGMCRIIGSATVCSHNQYKGTLDVFYKIIRQIPLNQGLSLTLPSQPRTLRLVSCRVCQFRRY